MAAPSDRDAELASAVANSFANVAETAGDEFTGGETFNATQAFIDGHTPMTSIKWEKR
jgi:predicted regulator of Ras-like GTPase activity (Roadblock/LC7/MglB family)